MGALNEGDQIDELRVTPDKFVPLAETSGLMEQMTHWVLNAALKQMAEWSGDGLSVGIKDCYDAVGFPTEVNSALFTGFIQLGAGLAVGLSGLAAGFAIGIVGDAGVRGTAQQPRLFVGMILILIFAEVLGKQFLHESLLHL